MRDLRTDEMSQVYGAGGRGSCRPPRAHNPCGTRGRGSRSKGKGGGSGSRSKGRGRCGKGGGSS